MDTIKNINSCCGKGHGHRVNQEVRLACGNKGPIFDIFDKQGQTLDLTSVDIDLTGLVNSLVKIDFSTTIVVEVETRTPGSVNINDVELLFILSRICEDGREQQLETYNFARDFNITGATEGVNLVAKTTDPISFTFCDCVSTCKSDCCKYIVRVFVKVVDTVPTKVARIDGSFINAIAQGIIDC